MSVMLTMEDVNTLVQTQLEAFLVLVMKDIN